MAVSVKEIAMFAWLRQLLQQCLETRLAWKLARCPRCARLMVTQQLSRGKIWFCHTCGYFKDYP